MVKKSLYVSGLFVVLASVLATEMAFAFEWDQISCLNRERTEWGNFDDTLNVDRQGAKFTFLSQGVGINDLKIEGTLEAVHYDVVNQIWNLKLRASDASDFWLSISEDRKAKVTFEEKGQYSVVFEKGFEYCRGLSKADFPD